MAIFDVDTGYYDASKMGKEEMAKLEKLGRYPYLRDLDTLIRGTRIISRVNLGLIEVPLRQIVGTYTKMRSNSFSKSFLPIIRGDSEFAQKWSNVYNIQQEEGLRDPIKAYEFMNRIYVVEGNKRISVLKYCDSYSYTANVTRLMPQKDSNDIKSMIYYACLDFYKLAGYNAIWFSKPEKYEKLVSLIERNKDKFVAENPYKYVSTILYEKFRNLYYENGGKNLPITTADAFLYFSSINGFDEHVDSDKYKSILERYIQTLQTTTSSNIDEYITVDIPTKTASPASKIRRNRLKVGFIYPDDAQKAWSSYHYESEQHLKEKYAGSIITKNYKNVTSRSRGHETIDKIVDENDVVFAISPLYYRGLLRASLEHTDKSLFLCSSFSMFKYVETYYGRSYELAFILGAVGASLTKNDVILFVAPHIVPSTVMNLNAFAQGAKLINANTKVRLITKNSSIQSDSDFKALVNERISEWDSDICYSASFFMDSKSKFRHMGLYKNNYGTWKRIARSVWHWNDFYETIMEEILSDRFTALSNIRPNKNKRLNYWWGLDTGLLDVETDETLSANTLKLIKFLKDGIVSKIISPFMGPIYDQEDNLRIKENEIARLSEIIGMDWIAKDISCNIKYDKLKTYLDRFNGSIH